MADIVKAPECCRLLFGPLFERIAEGRGAQPFFQKFCTECRRGELDKELCLDFSGDEDDQSIRGMTKQQLLHFKDHHAPSWRVTVVGEILRTVTTYPVYQDKDACLEGPMQKAWDALTQPCTA